MLQGTGLGSPDCKVGLDLKTANRAIDAAVNGLRNTISTMEEKESANSSTNASLDVGTAPTVYL